MNRDAVRQVANVVAYVGVVAVNMLANALPLNGQTTAEIANRFPVFFVPAGFTFAIWGVIYLFLGGFVAYQALPSQRRNPNLGRIGYLFVVASAANIAWLFLWHYNYFALSLLAMLVLLASLIAIYLRLDIGRRAVPRAEKWLVHVTFSIYLGWITIATIANVAIVLFDAGWDGFGISGPLWAAILLTLGTIITLMVIITRTDVAFSLVVLWAYAGITVRQAGTPLVSVTAAGTALLLAVALVIAVLQKRQVL